MDKRGCFIVLEGIDGSGKTSQVSALVDRLEKEGYLATGTCEPTRSATGLLCRKYLKDEKSDVRVDALVFAADRLEHYFSEIEPLLNKGYIVISDRYKLSSFVYQQSQGAPLDWIREINKFAPDADITFYLDVSYQTAIKRISDKGDTDLEKFENSDSLRQIQDLYREFSTEFIRIDAEKDEEQITDEIYQFIKEKCIGKISI